MDRSPGQIQLWMRLDCKSRKRRAQPFRRLCKRANGKRRDRDRLEKRVHGTRIGVDFRRHAGGLEALRELQALFSEKVAFRNDEECGWQTMKIGSQRRD